MSETQTTLERAALLELHDWDELVFGGFYCLHCSPDDGWSDTIAWPCQPLREAGVTDEEAVELIQAHREKVVAEHRAMQEAEKAEGQRRADEWNARHPVGTRVMAYPGIRPDDPITVAYQKRVAEGLTFGVTDPCERLKTRTRSVAWTLSHGEPIVMVDGHSGGIALTHVDVIPRDDTIVEERQLTADSFYEIDTWLDEANVFAKAYTETRVGRVVTTGLRIGEKPGHVVAKFGDTIVRHADGSHTVRRADEAVS